MDLRTEGPRGARPRLVAGSYSARLLTSGVNSSMNLSMCLHGGASDTHKHGHVARWGVWHSGRTAQSAATPASVGVDAAKQRVARTDSSITLASKLMACCLAHSGLTLACTSTTYAPVVAIWLTSDLMLLWWWSPVAARMPENGWTERIGE